MPTNHCTLLSVKAIITHSAPHILVADFNSTFILVSTIDQPNISLYTALTCKKYNRYLSKWWHLLNNYDIVRLIRAGMGGEKGLTQAVVCIANNEDTRVL